MGWQKGEERIRSFIAFEINELAMSSRIGDLQRELIQSGSSIRIVSVENMHITLSFLGEIPRTTIDLVIAELSQIDFAPFEISLRGLGAFPNLRRINIVWVGIDRGREELQEIFQLLRPRLRRVGLTGVGKRFSPHITIARVKSRRNIDQLSKRLVALRDIEIGHTLLDTLKLKKSVLTPKGPVYTTLAEIVGREIKGSEADLDY